MELVEGSGRAKLGHVIKMLGFNRDIDLELATVTGALPNIKIKIDNMPVELDVDDLIVCEHLTEHSRQVTISGSTSSAITFKSALSVGDRVIVASINKDQRYVVIDKVGRIGGGSFGA